MTHANAPLTVEGRRRLIERCRTRPIAHVAAEASVSRACLSKWQNRYDTYGETGLRDRSSVPHPSPTQTPPEIVERIERLRRNHKWSARRITLELTGQGVRISERTVGRWLERLADNGANYRAAFFTRSLTSRASHHQRTRPYTPRHNGKVERYQRILAEELLYARHWVSEEERARAIAVWNVHYNYHQPHTTADNRPPASRLRRSITNVMASNI